MTETAQGRTLIVTGTTSGMGREIALAGAAAGFATIATYRDTERAKILEADAKSNGLNLDIRFLEITDHASVEAFVETVANDYGHIDAVVSQAGGIFSLGTAEQISMEGFRAVMETNFFGNLAVIRAVLPYLRTSRGRLVVTTSANGLVGAPYNDAYTSSKFALEGLVESFAPVVARHGVKTTIFEPGPVVTDVMALRRQEKLIPNAVVPNNPYPEPWDFLSRVIGNISYVQPVEEIGPMIMELLNSENPPLRLQSAPWVTEFVAPKLTDPDGSRVSAASEAYLALAG